MVGTILKDVDSKNINIFLSILSLCNLKYNLYAYRIVFFQTPSLPSSKQKLWSISQVLVPKRKKEKNLLLCMEQSRIQELNFWRKESGLALRLGLFVTFQQLFLAPIWRDSSSNGETKVVLSFHCQFISAKARSSGMIVT